MKTWSTWERSLPDFRLVVFANEKYIYHRSSLGGTWAFLATWLYRPHCLWVQIQCFYLVVIVWIASPALVSLLQIERSQWGQCGAGSVAAYRDVPVLQADFWHVLEVSHLAILASSPSVSWIFCPHQFSPHMPVLSRLSLHNHCIKLEEVNASWVLTSESWFCLLKLYG